MRVAINREWLDGLNPTYHNVVAAIACITKQSRRKVRRRLGLRPISGCRMAIYIGNEGVGFLSADTSPEYLLLTAELQQKMVWSGYDYRSTTIRAYLSYRRYMKERPE